MTRKTSTGWGGYRPGAGRKPKGAKAGTSHRTRETHTARFPVLLTMRIAKDLPSLRRKKTFVVLCDVFHAANARPGFRIAHFSVQSDHLLFLVEAGDRETLSRSTQSLSIRIALALNALWGRTGTVFADRYEDRVLRTPADVRDALGYVLKSALLQRGGGLPDAFSSGPWFDGWKGGKQQRQIGEDDPLVAPRTSLLKSGWRKLGLIDTSSAPVPPRPVPRTN